MIIDPESMGETSTGNRVIAGDDSDNVGHGEDGGRREGQRGAIFFEYPELRTMYPDRYDFVRMFSPNRKGHYQNRQNKYKLKILNAVSGVLARALRGGERVVGIGKGTAWYPAEILLGNGILTMLYNVYAIVCTDERILLVNTDYRMTRPTHYLFQMAYGDLTGVKRGRIFGSLVISRRTGRRRVFTGVRHYLAKELEQTIRERLAVVKPIPHKQGSFDHLCPSCFHVLDKGLKDCPYCRASFKRPRAAVLRSILLPGWGDIYLGHRVLGILELCGSIVIWVLAISMFLHGAEGNLILPLVIILLYYVIDGLLTHHMAKKGYMLASA
jgi:hypothetical protein